jgi:hypothetical protein
MSGWSASKLALISMTARTEEAGSTAGGITTRIIYALARQFEAEQAEMLADIRDIRLLMTSIEVRLGLLRTDRARLRRPSCP